jgi:hypothetical protein
MQRETATHRPDLPHQFIPVVEQCQLDECEVCGRERAVDLHDEHVALRERASGPTLVTEKGV